MFKSMVKNFKVMKYVFIYCKSYVIFSLLFIIASIVNAISKYYVIKYIIDLVTIDKNLDKTLEVLFIYLIILLITSFFRGMYQRFLSLRNRTIFSSRIQRLMFEKVKDIDMKDFDNPDFFDTFSRAVRDGSFRGIRVYEDMINFLNSILISISLSTIIIISDYILMSIIFVSAILCALFINIANKLTYKAYKKVEPNNRMYHYINRIFYQQKYAGELKTTTINNLLIDKYLEETKVINKELIKSGKSIMIFNGANTFSKTLIEHGGTYIYLTKKLFEGLSISNFTSILNASLQFSSNFVDAITFLTRLKDNALYVDDFLEFMNYQPLVENRGKLHLTDKLKEISIESLDFKYPDNDFYNLKEVNLKIKHGEKIAIVGMNGAGKTTLIKLLLKFYQPESGKIYFNNDDYFDLITDEVRNKYSIVFQDYQIYAATIGENILMRKLETKDDYDKVWKALELVGLLDKVKALPKGLDTLVTREFDRNGEEFSGGERQRLVISRVFASDADIYVLDEPTSALDPLAEYQINQLIMKNANNQTIIIIAHRLSTVVDADRIILINNGKIEEAGTHQELLNYDGLYAKMFNTQASLYVKQYQN